MALRDKMFERVGPHLPAGEKPHTVIPGQTGPNPMWVLVSFWIVFFGQKLRVIAVTDQGTVHVYKMSFWKMGQPKELLYSLPAGTRLMLPNQGPIRAKLPLGEEKIWIHRRFYGDLEAADRQSTRMATG